MKILKSSLLILLAFFSLSSAASDSEIYNPFLYGNPERLDLSKGFCKKPIEEKKLWVAINKFSKSFLFVVPNLPPEQKAYIEGEFNSGNTLRKMRITNSAMYKISRVRDVVLNIEKLSSTYLQWQNTMKLENKLELIGRTLLNLDSEYVQLGDFDDIAKELVSKNFYITMNDLVMYDAISSGLKVQVIYQLICYGEN